ncbi:His-rich protein BRANT [Bradyrhizobium sp.]|uniref:His-rich protein BRANT n=1 Tax=Bradyrhizobium sp. TaxID=376 RepID=UPI003C473F7F
MLKTISAALLAVSMLAAPAFAASSDKTTQAPVTKSTQLKTGANSAGKISVKHSPLNANAKLSHHRAHHKYHKVHRHHTKKVGALKSPSKTHSKVSSRHGASAIKRG